MTPIPSFLNPLLDSEALSCLPGPDPFRLLGGLILSITMSFSLSRSVCAQPSQLIPLCFSQDSDDYSIIRFRSLSPAVQRPTSRRVIPPDGDVAPLEARPATSASPTYPLFDNLLLAGSTHLRLNQPLIPPQPSLILAAPPVLPP